MFRLPPGLLWWRGGLCPRAPLQPLPLPGHQPRVRGAVVAAGPPPAHTPPAAPRPLQVSLIVSWQVTFQLYPHLRLCRLIPVMSFITISK